MLLLLIAGALVEPAFARAQMLFVTGGDVLSNDPEVGAGARHQAGFQVGGRLWLSDLFQVQGGLTYQDVVSAEAALLVRPFAQTRRVEPYALVGVGGFLDGTSDPRMVSMGLGLEYHVGENLGVLFEIAGRWTLQDEGLFKETLDLGVMPSVGFSYRLGGPRSPEVEVERPPVRTLADASEEAVPRPIALVDQAAAQAGVGRQRLFVLPARKDSLTLRVYKAMVLVPDGTFILGLTDEDPLQLQTAGLRRITLSSFYIEQHEVTNAEYRAFLAEAPPEQRAQLLPDTTMGRATGNRFSWSEYFRGSAFDDYPVVGVTFEQAEAYCAFYGKRLPTEAEWEYAARAGHLGGVYPWAGLEARDEAGHYRANYNPGRGGYAADGYAFTAPVDAFLASAWKLYNMSGNAAEWCQDTYHPSYSSLSDFNPLYLDPNEDRRIVRGGSWASDAFYIGVGVRDAQPAGEASPYVGFRCVMDLANVDEPEDEQAVSQQPNDNLQP